MKRHLPETCLYSFFLIFFPLFGQEAAEGVEQHESADPKDYSKGFAKFYEFGLPDVKDAEYVNASVYSIYELGRHDMLRHRVGLGGNAWMLSEDEELGKAELVLSQGALLTVYEYRTQMARKRKGEASAEDDSEVSERVIGSWAKADAKKDADALIKFLDELDDGERYFVDNSLGDCFLFAIHLHSKGLTTEGNKLAGLLFKLGNGRRQVILQGLNALADVQYTVAFIRFKNSRDMDRFAEEVNDLLGRYGKAWRNASGLQKLADSLKEQNKSLENTLSAVSGEDKEVVSGLVKEGWLKSVDRDLWILKKPLSEGEDGAGTKAFELGMGSVPVLIALLGNETLIPVAKSDLPSLQRHRVYSSTSFVQKDADTIFNEIERPAMLGEAASQLLRMVIPIEDATDEFGQVMPTDISEEDDETLKILAHAWYEQNKSKAPAELATVYLEDGNNSQKQEAVDFLLAVGDQSAYPGIESYILNAPRERFGEQFNDQLALKYCAKRGQGARDFAEKYIAMLDPAGTLRGGEGKPREKPKAAREEEDEDDGFIGDVPDEYNDYQARVARSIIDRIEMLTSGELVGDIIDKIIVDAAAGESDFRRVGMLREMLAIREVGIDELIGIAAGGALKAADGGQPELAKAFLQMARLSKSRFIGGHRFFDDDDEGVPEDFTPDAKKNGDIWKKLLSNDTVIDKYSIGFPLTIGDYSSLHAEVLYGEGKSEAYSPLLRLGRPYLKRLRERGIARFDGVLEDQLPELPSVGGEDAETKVSEMLDRVKKAEDLAEFARKLDVKEMLLFQNAISKDDSQNARLFPDSLRIEIVRSSVEGSESLSTLKGKSLSEKTFDELRGFAEKQLASNKNIFCRIYKTPCRGGVEIDILEKPGNGEDRLVLVTLLRIPGEFRARTTWQAAREDAPAVKKDGAGSELDDLFGEMEQAIMSDAETLLAEKQREFIDKIRLLERGGYNTALPVEMYIMGEAL